jgi:hypothetical protein
VPSPGLVEAQVSSNRVAVEHEGLFVHGGFILAGGGLVVLGVQLLTQVQLGPYVPLSLCVNMLSYLSVCF